MSSLALQFAFPDHRPYSDFVRSSPYIFSYFLSQQVPYLPRARTSASVTEQNSCTGDSNPTINFSSKLPSRSSVRKISSTVPPGLWSSEERELGPESLHAENNFEGSHTLLIDTRFPFCSTGLLSLASRNSTPLDIPWRPLISTT